MIMHFHFSREKYILFKIQFPSQCCAEKLYHLLFSKMMVEKHIFIKDRVIKSFGTEVLFSHYFTRI